MPTKIYKCGSMYIKGALYLFIIIMLSSCTLTEYFRKTSKPSNKITYNEQHQTRTLKQTGSDLRISSGIHIDLVALDLYKQVTVTVNKGIVTYTGTVPTERDKLVALGVAWKQNGVKKVINNLEVAK